MTKNLSLIRDDCFEILDSAGTMRIGTLEGDHRADVGHFIIKGVAGGTVPSETRYFC